MDHMLLAVVIASSAFSLAPPHLQEAADDHALRELVEALNDSRFAARQSAMRRLVRAGAPAVPLVATACQSNARETAERAFEILYRLSITDDEPAKRLARSALEELASSPTTDVARMARRAIQRRRAAVISHLESLGGSFLGGEGRITTIYLTGRAISDEDVALLLEFPELQALSLSATNVGDNAMRYVKQLKNLERLDLFESQVGDEGLRHLKELPKLRWLPMGHTKVTNAGLVHLREMNSLEYVGLRGDRITDDGLVHLSGLTNLTGLFLGETEISDAGLEHLRKLTNMRSLRLHQTRVSDAGIECLKEMTQLGQLDVYDTQISESGVRQLRQWFPDCQIVTKNPMP